MTLTLLPLLTTSLHVTSWSSRGKNSLALPLIPVVHTDTTNTRDRGWLPTRASCTGRRWVKRIQSEGNRLMFVPCIIRRSRNNQQYALICIAPLFRRNHDNPAHRSRNHTLYIWYTTYSICISSNSDGSRSSLMMADYCRNMYEAVCRIKEWYKPVHIVGYFYYEGNRIVIKAT
jgi:hypothetical protein